MLYENSYNNTIIKREAICLDSLSSLTSVLFFFSVFLHWLVRNAAILHLLDVYRQPAEYVPNTKGQAGGAHEAAKEKEKKTFLK